MKITKSPKSEFVGYFSKVTKKILNIPKPLLRAILILHTQKQKSCKTLLTNPLFIKTNP
jgi:hypothetical protein